MLVNAKAPLPEQASQIESSITKVLQGQKLKALFCVAGGWAGGNAASPGTRIKHIYDKLVLCLMYYRLYQQR